MPARNAVRPFGAGLLAMAMLLGAWPAHVTPVHAQSPLPAQAQAGPPAGDLPAVGPPASDPPASDPPGRVGRVARIVGAVSFRTGEQSDWQPTTANYPVTSGQAYWTEPGAQAEFEVAGTRLVLDQGSELVIDALDDRSITARLAQGNVALVLRRMAAGDTVTLHTPRGTVTIADPGRYVLQTGDTGRPGLVTVIEGAAQVAGPGLALTIGSGQTATISGQESLQGSIGPQASDPFIIANAMPLRPAVIGPATPPEQVQEMTGGAALAEAGQWDSVAEYGRVWYPPVASNWVPYREGHWAHVLPWGWTWIDDAPWGFAPFHYGRWLQIGPRWAWAPGWERAEGWAPGWGEGHRHRPVYAPALVAFVGFGAGAALGARFGSPVGWVPLGPREHYRPAFRASPGYAERINLGHGPDMNNTQYLNRHGTTVVPASAMINSRPVARNTRLVSPQTMAAAQPLVQPPSRPSQANAGLSAPAGRGLGFALGPMVATPRPQAPGLAVNSRALPTAPMPVPIARPVAQGAFAPRGQS
ncbi:MAG: hypothetical protein H7251_05830, partial [Acetobacteraceae bacterium]|nr:hypothetical protein [Acetobacteraceae bacterium]